MEKVEFLILRNLLYNEEYVRKVVPFLKAEYFENFNEKVVFEEILNFVQEYNQPATREVLCIETEKRQDINDSSFKEISDLITSLEESPSEFNWLVDTTEKWCRDRAIYLALMESIQLADGKDDTKGRDAIPTILSDALAVSFDSNVGHDYLTDYEERYESYHRKEDKIPFDLEYFDKITKGGLPNKTLNIALAGTGVGKSLFMCHVASSVLLQGKNVLYITLEMAEEKIAERIDANLGSNVNSYSYIKAIAEELRGLAVEANLPIVSATQTTRSGFASSDVDLTDTSESFGLPATADLMFALISTEELEGLNQIMVKQLKNRYNDPTVNKRFIVGIDRAKMRLYDCEQNAQQDVIDNGQEEEYNPEEKPKKSFNDFYKVNHIMKRMFFI
jgi:hypothetical protein